HIERGDTPPVVRPTTLIVLGFFLLTGLLSACQGSHTDTVRKERSIVVWGCKGAKDVGFDFGQCDRPAAAESGVQAIAASDFYNVALTKDGRVVAWGCRDIDISLCDVPAAAESGVIAIAAGGALSLALTRDGRGVAWGCTGEGDVAAAYGSGVTAKTA